MKKLLLFLLFVSVVHINAQNEYVNQVLLLNEGSYDYYNDIVIDPVTIGAYNPVNNSYNTVIEVADARFASDLIIDEPYFYVAADNKILKYDLNTYELISAIDMSGVRKISIYNDYLIASRGDYDLTTYSAIIFDSYLHIYSKNDFSLLFSFDVDNGPAWSTESLLIHEYKLYVAINNAFDYGNYKGIIGVVDLMAMTYVNEIDLGEDGKNPINMMFKNDNIYTLNNKNWDGSSISSVDLSNLDTETTNLSTVSAGCGVSIIRDEKINYQKSGDTEMYIFDLDTESEIGVEQNLNYNYYAISEQPLNNYLYAAISNFTSDAEVVIYDNDNNLVNSFFADVATSKIVFDIRTSNVSSIIEKYNSNDIVKTIDLLGRSVNSNYPISIDVLKDGTSSKKFIIKQ